MISVDQIVNKLGKRKAVDFIVNHRSKDKTKAEQDRGIKGRVRFRMCEHRTWIIDNYEPKECSKCIKESLNHPFIQVHEKEYFNIGTGTYGTTTEHRKAAKAQGLLEAG